MQQISSVRSSYAISLNALRTIGMAMRNVTASLTAWHIATPISPKSFGRRIMNGIKMSPRLADDNILARSGRHVV